MSAESVLAERARVNERINAYREAYNRLYGEYPKSAAYLGYGWVELQILAHWTDGRPHTTLTFKKCRISRLPEMTRGILHHLKRTQLRDGVRVQKAL